jgi:hypothetical protein
MQRDRAALREGFGNQERGDAFARIGNRFNRR